MKILLRLLSVLVFSSVASIALAQSSLRITPYLWGAGFDGTVGASGSGAGIPGIIDVNTGSLSDSLRVAGAMLHVNWRNDRWSAFGDWTYANAKADAPSPFTTLYAGVDVKVKGHIVEGYGGYEVTGAPDSHVDVFAGARYYTMEASLGLREGTLPGATATSDQNWVDGVIGTRLDTRFAENWEAFASADVGTGGSRLSWQLFAGVGYRFGWGSIVGGWRHLHVDVDKSNFRLDGALSGPFLGASFTF